MKYIMEKDGKDFAVDVPEGSTIRSEPIPCSDGKMHASLLRISVIGTGGVIADFLGVGAFYPEEMKPQKKTWVKD